MTFKLCATIVKLSRILIKHFLEKQGFWRLLMLVSILALVGLLVVGWFLLSAIVGVAFSFGHFIISVLIWMVIGWLAGQLVKGGGYGPINNAILGLSGGIVGGLVLGALGIGTDGFIGTIIGGVVGAIIVIGIVRLLFNNNFAR
jgi:uncharacterized membrane protein YeaQ/YmgE (transglycosylase-associated protein family)